MADNEHRFEYGRPRTLRSVHVAPGIRAALAKSVFAARLRCHYCGQRVKRVDSFAHFTEGCEAAREAAKKRAEAFAEGAAS